MSRAVEKRNIAERSRCSRLWTIFPHVCLILSLAVYGCFGALVFSHIEGQSNTTKNEYNAFLHALVDTVNNSDNHELLMKKVDQIAKKFNPIWLESPERWNFFGSLFFCCTVLSTVAHSTKSVAYIYYAISGLLFRDILLCIVVRSIVKNQQYISVDSAAVNTGYQGTQTAGLHLSNL